MHGSTLKIGGLYRHYRNGNFYRVRGLVKHSETLEDLVLYEALYDNGVSKLWVRPLVMFLEQVSWEGSETPRFIFQAEE